MTKFPDIVPKILISSQTDQNCPKNIAFGPRAKFYSAVTNLNDTWSKYFMSLLPILNWFVLKTNRKKHTAFGVRASGIVSPFGSRFIYHLVKSQQYRR
jgi:hypothetical protein